MFDNDLPPHWCRECFVYPCECAEKDKKKIESAVIGFVSDSALLGGIIGGDLMGGVIGDFLNGGDL